MPVKFGENVLSERKVGLLWVFIFFMENEKTPVKDGSGIRTEFSSQSSSNSQKNVHSHISCPKVGTSRINLYGLRTFFSVGPHPHRLAKNKKKKPLTRLFFFAKEQ